MIASFSLNEMTPEPLTVVTVGTFDGVHLGHQSILRNVVERATAIGGRSVVVTFDPHPREIVGRGPVEYLSTVGERLERIAAHGIDLALVIRFTFEFSQQTAEEFYRRTLLPHVGVREVIVGHDHMFGKDRQAGFAEIERIGALAGFTAHLVPPIVLDGNIVSSSAIRKLLREGDVVSAAQFLGYDYGMRGTVVQGDGRGRTIGFPTANLSIPNAGKLIPANGVYLVRVKTGETHGPAHFGMMNIGTRPTFGESSVRSVEVYIFDFDKHVYGEDVTVEFLQRIRAERKFASKDELVAQLELDEATCRRLLAGLPQLANLKNS